ncbi:hypothetical protein VPH35_073195 [Triticum aestivum]
MELAQEDVEKAHHSSADAIAVDGEEFGEDGTKSGPRAQRLRRCLSMLLTLQPPLMGQVPGRSSPLPGYKVGCGRGHDDATHATAVASTRRRPRPTPVVPMRNTSIAATKLPIRCSHMRN